MGDTNSVRASTATYQSGTPALDTRSPFRTLQGLGLRFCAWSAEAIASLYVAAAEGTDWKLFWDEVLLVLCSASQCGKTKRAQPSTNRKTM